MNNNIYIQLIGFLGIALNFIIFQQKERKKLVMAKLCSDVVWALHYFLLHAYSGFAIAVVGIFREIVSYNKHKKWASSILWPVLFIAIGVSAAFISGRNVYCFLPAIASAISVVCFWQNKTSNSRIMALPISLCMIIYSALSNSVAGVVNEILTMASVVLGFLKNDLNKTKKTM